MVNLLEFLPKSYTENKYLKKAENVFFYIVLFMWSVMTLLFSEIRNHDEFVYPILVICIIEIVLTGTFFLDIREVILVLGLGVYHSIEAGGLTFNTNILIVYEFFFAGKMFILNAGKGYKKRMLQWFLVMAISMCIGSILDFTTFEAVDGVRIARWCRFWSGKAELSTHYAFYVIPIVCLVFWALCTFARHIVLSIVIIAGVVVVNIQMLKSYTRMDAVITAIVCLVMGIVYFAKNYKKKLVRIIYGIAVIILLIAMSMALSYILNNDSLYQVIYKTLNRDNGVVHNVRLEYMAEVLRELPGHPFGDIVIGEGELAHNVWLDIARVSGIVPFIIILIYSGVCIYDAIVCILKEKNKQGYAYFVVALFIGLYIYYMIEPAYIVSTYFWATGCMVSGAIRAMNYRALRDKDKSKKRRRKAKKTPLVAGVLAMSMMFTGCSLLDNLIAKPVDTDEYVDTGEYDDIALMGEGTKEDPYLINDYNDLIYLYNAVNTGWLFDDKYILQTNDIDMSGQPFWPIAEYTTPYSFLGTYDGGGHVIQNVCLYTEYYSAIFGKLGGTVMNLGIVDGYIQGWKAAGLVGICTSHDAKILNCYTITTLAGKETAGIVSSASGMIEGCFSMSSLYGSEKNEFISLSGDGVVNRCYATLPIYENVVYGNIWNEAIWLNEKSINSFNDVENELNKSVDGMSRRSGITCEDFCIWKVTDDGKSIRLITKKVEADEMYDKFDLRAFMIRNYPCSPMVISMIIMIFVTLSIIGVNGKKNKDV